MFQNSANRKKLFGAILAISIFFIWIIVDLYLHALYSQADYQLYEIFTYGSWGIISILCVWILYSAGWFPMRQQTSESLVEE